MTYAGASDLLGQQYSFGKILSQFEDQLNSIEEKCKKIIQKSENITELENSLEPNANHEANLALPEQNLSNSKIDSTQLEKIINNFTSGNFSQTLALTQEIHQELREIRTFWLQGYDLEQEEIKDLNSIIEALSQFQAFTIKYWNFFTSEDKNDLKKFALTQLQAYQGNVWFDFFKILVSGQLLKWIKVFSKYFHQVRENPKNNIFTSMKDTSLSLAETIIYLNDNDESKPFYETATNEEWIDSFDEWSKNHAHEPAISDIAINRESLYEEND